MNKLRVTGAALAITAAAAFSFAPVVATAAGQSSMINCMGGNACKGQSSCKTAHNACKGQNSCKGKGVMQMTKKACKKAGGKAAKAM